MNRKQTTLECLIRAPDVVDLLEDYDNDYLYYLDGEQLSLQKSLSVLNKSPSGFRHGYGGSGPAQLALTICLELYGEPVAKVVYQDFKREFIASLPQEEEFNETLLVPVNPLEHYHIPDEAVDGAMQLGVATKTDEKRQAEANEQQPATSWQQKLQAEYESVLHLPGDQRFDFHTEMRKKTWIRTALSLSWMPPVVIRKSP